MTPRLSDSRLANVGAKTIRTAYVTFHEQFRAITGRAGIRFDTQDWPGLQADTAERLGLYRRIVDLVEAAIRDLLGDRVENKVIWASMKAVYSGLITDRDDWELAETFFNSATRRIFTTVGVDPQIEFVATDFETPPTRPRSPVYRSYNRITSTAVLVAAVLQDFAFDTPYEDAPRDVALVAARIEAQLEQLGALQSVDRLELIRSPFYRGMGVYLVGRLFSGSHRIPFALALIHGPQGIAVDTILLDENSVSILFSFAHSYFHVDVDRPYDLVHFLTTLMPRKRLGELYISIGYHKHGKTELYRNLLDHLAYTTEKFEIARGQRGMVMLVFTMPGYDMVFKLIKDFFNYPKGSTRKEVRAKYDLVYRHDRAGRLVDAQSFEFLAFSRALFSDELLDVLAADCVQSVTITDDTVIIAHAYVQRRVIPLDIYIRNAHETAARAAVCDYGRAIKDMASCNIFPGDMLLKNFGVTRHGRVVFYDYDELCLLEECNFRRLPPSERYEDSMAAEPWFHVNPNDIFPEEFAHFLGLSGALREEFEQHHADLYTTDYWRGVQEAIRSGVRLHIYPYQPEQRLQWTKDYDYELSSPG
ncbi:MAG: bifunctional isocitrate dehydrogenase kinase/phosphatase [Anaerolineales bacterium]|uniref:bifunctional isocitrate dehydrogenase kinase/phosphatase n=1 Tax=Promineifilum sp. TaxID=2664178 RepID=UPI001D727434|nr:bifunctional isocitrate dehydrogenase kinase/phosphatase [Anaerolineales bacterium]MCB8936544.1 bifunctional isocitrate dehydrogenase kinase/phosphatase [Promineifilum sp.]MCO5178728.1 bifunctional isocitrate dehydrogenase kinase/phosphatase [Promineifilum sp.]